MAPSIAVNCLHIVKWFQLQFNPNSPIFIQLNGFEHSKGLNSSIWFIDGILTSTTPPGSSRPGSNVNVGVFYTQQSSRTGALPLDCLESYLGHLLVGFYSAKMQFYSTVAAD